MNQLGNISIRVSLTDVNIIKLDSMTGLSSIPGLVNTGEQKRTWLSLKLKKITVERSRVRIQTHTIVFKAFYPLCNGQ